MPLIRKETVKNDGNVYEYMLYLNESERFSSFRLPLYSIEIKLTLSDGTVSNYMSEDLFSDFNEAVNFYERLIKNLATPMNLPYVIADSLS